jgi:hypothetical protein
VANPVAPGNVGGSNPVSSSNGSAPSSADGLAVKSRDSESTILTVNPPRDESAGTPDRGDHGSISAEVPARGEISVVSKLDPRSAQFPTSDPHEPTIQNAGQPESSWVGDRPLDSRPVAAGESALEDGGERRVDLETPRFREADVLASCRPFERGALERAIDRFLEHLGGSDSSVLPGLLPFSNMVPGVVVVVGTVLAIETLRRRGCNDRDDSSTGDQAEGVEHPGFPGLPGRWRIWALEER